MDIETQKLSLIVKARSIERAKNTPEAAKMELNRLIKEEIEPAITQWKLYKCSDAIFCIQLELLTGTYHGETKDTNAKEPC